MQVRQWFQRVGTALKKIGSITKINPQRFIIYNTGFMIVKSQFVVKGKRDVC